MQLLALKSKLIQANDDLISTIEESLKGSNQTLENHSVLVIASKVVAYAQGQLVSVNNNEEFKKLVQKEADEVLDEGMMTMTLKNKILIPNAGIDNSNVPKGKVILWPMKPFKTAREIRKNLMEKYNLKEFGVLITDSHCQPLRQGTVGIAMGWAGFEGVVDERGNPDLFNQPMQYTKIAIADNLASAATLLMGETNASVPFVLVKNLKLNWTEKEGSENNYWMEPDRCIFKGVFNY